MGALVDVYSPKSFDALEGPERADEHTGARAGFGQASWRIALEETTGAQRPFQRGLSSVLRLLVHNRTTTYFERFSAESCFGAAPDYTWAETPPDYSPPATIVFAVHRAAQGYWDIASHVGSLDRHYRNPLAHGATSQIEQVASSFAPLFGARSWVTSPEPAVRKRLRALLEAEQAPVEGSIAELAGALRSCVDLPVQDLAQMAGVGRRQFYNYVRGESQPSRQTEQRMRRLAAMLAVLASELGAPEAVRAAVLTPIDGGGTFYDVARRGGADRLAAAFERLREQVSGTAADDRALPPSGTLPADAPEWEQAQSMIGSRGSARMGEEDAAE